MNDDERVVIVSLSVKMVSLYRMNLGPTIVFDAPNILEPVSDRLAKIVRVPTPRPVAANYEHVNDLFAEAREAMPAVETRLSNE